MTTQVSPFSISEIVSPHFAFSQRPGSMTVLTVIERTDEQITAYALNGGYNIRIEADGCFTVLEEKNPLKGQIQSICWQGVLPGSVRSCYNSSLDYVWDQVKAGYIHPALRESSRVKIPCSLLKALADEVARHDPQSPLVQQAYTRLGLRR